MMTEEQFREYAEKKARRRQLENQLESWAGHHRDAKAMEAARLLWLGCPTLATSQLQQVNGPLKQGAQQFVQEIEEICLGIRLQPPGGKP